MKCACFRGTPASRDGSEALETGRSIVATSTKGDPPAWGSCAWAVQGSDIPAIHCRGVSELLAGVLVSVEDIRLDAAIPSLPGSEIDVHFSAGLGFTRRAGEVHDEFMRPSAFGNAASLPQELLQVEDLVGIADIDVHAAGRSGVAATESPLSLSSETPVCQ